MKARFELNKIVAMLFYASVCTLAVQVSLMTEKILQQESFNLRINKLLEPFILFVIFFMIVIKWLSKKKYIQFEKDRVVLSGVFTALTTIENNDLKSIRLLDFFLFSLIKVSSQANGTRTFIFFWKFSDRKNIKSYIRKVNIDFN